MTGLRFAMTALVLGLSLGLAGCGVRGPLEQPPGATAEPVAPDQTPNAGPAKPTILDGLLE